MAATRGGQRSSAWRAWLLETRPHFLLLTPACVLVGAAAAYWDRGGLDPLYLALAFIGALLAHISVNVLNDVDDFRSGVDLHTKPTPFSGGSGFLVRGELSPQGVRRLGLASLAGIFPIGAYFLWRHGWGILPLGVVGVALVVLYTRWITQNAWLCLLAPGLGFGPLMVLGVYFCQSGAYGKTAVVASVVPGFLVSNLLLLNQFPDVEADAVGGRGHIPMRWGLKRAARLYALMLLLPFGWLGLVVTVGLLPVGASLAAMTLPLAIRTARGVLRHFGDLPHHLPLMGANVAVTLLTPTLLAVGMILQRML